MDEYSAAIADIEDMSNLVEYDAETDTYRASFNGRAEPVSMTVISLLAAVTDTNPVEMEPLYSIIDTDALNTLMTPDITTRSNSDTHVTFTLDGHEVTVHSYGIISVERKGSTDA